MLYSCGSGANASTTASPAVQPDPGISRAVVTTAVARIRNFQYAIHSNGKIRSGHDQVFSSMTGGSVLTCNARTGASFRAGEMIAQLDTEAISNRLERAKLARFNGEKEYESQLLGYEALLKDKSPEQAEKIRQKLRISSGLAGSERDMQEAMQELTKSLIRAPFTGILADVKIREGSLLKPGDELFRLYGRDDLFLEVKVLESDVPLLKLQSPAAIAPLFDEKASVSGVVSEINPYVDEGGMVLVKLRISGSRQQGAPAAIVIFPGMNCTAIIKVPARKALCIPKEAVVMRSGQPIVFTVEKGKTKWNYVSTGKENDGEMEILNGLKPGDKVIVTNNLQLSDDIPVEESSINHP